MEKEKSGKDKSIMHATGTERRGGREEEREKN